LHANPILDNTGAAPKISECAIRIEGPHGLLTDFSRPVLITSLAESGRIPSRTEAIDEECDIAALGPERAPPLVPLGKTGRIVRTVRE
jgi:hypothetical protein